MSDEDEYAPLTRNVHRSHHGNVHNNSDNNCYNSGRDEDEEEDGEDDTGYTDYKQPRGLFRKARYSGYATLGRVSMHDAWDFDCKDDDDHNDEEHKRKTSVDHDEDDKNGDFVSFWKQDDDDGSRCSDSEPKNNPQHYEEQPPAAIVTGYSANDDDDDEDDRVETTMRPIPLLYRKYQGGLDQSILHDSSNKKIWFRRELGLANMHFDEKDDDTHRSNAPRKSNRTWGLWRSQNNNIASSTSEFDHSEVDEDGTNSLLVSSDDGRIGHHMPTPKPPRAQSPFRYGRQPSQEEGRRNDENLFGRRNERDDGILGLPIIRPFLRRSRRGFTDDTDENTSEVEDNDNDEIDDHAGGTPSRQDRVAVVESISRGIAGTKDDSLFLGSTSSGDIEKQFTIRQQRPNLLGRIFSTRFLQSPGGNPNDKTSIVQLHNHLRKEDWSLATTLLDSNPDLARMWHPIDRLYGGRYDGEALPIHAACALRPPPSFIEMLAALYPEGLLEKDKAFGRVPLHVACRSLAKSSVIRVLCEMDPKCIEEIDSLKRVPLHYLIKNYSTFGNDNDDSSIDGNPVDNTVDTDASNEQANNEEGMIALKLFVEINPNCVHAADHRGWLPIHVACSCSSRKGMIRAIKVLLKVWPESIHAKTDKDSDVFTCVDMAGKHHPTKDRVISLLQEAKIKVEQNESDADDKPDGADGENGDEDDSDKQVQSLSDRGNEGDKTELAEERSKQLDGEEEFIATRLSHGEMDPSMLYPESVLINL